MHLQLACFTTSIYLAFLGTWDGGWIIIVLAKQKFRSPIGWFKG